MRKDHARPVNLARKQVSGPLHFGNGNAKLDAAIFTFSLPAGHSCPFARECLARANRQDGTIRDGLQSRFRCYAASMEARHPSVRRSRWRNFALLKSCGSKREMTRLILDSLSPFVRLLRVHDSGDFFSQDYFDAWMDAAKARPETTFYAYSKALPYWVRRLPQVGDGYEPGRVPNLVLTASVGGSRDDLIARHGLRSARVVFQVEDAETQGLELDHDDSHAMTHGPNFALLLHGTQPPNTDAGRAVRELRLSGFRGYPLAMASQ